MTIATDAMTEKSINTMLGVDQMSGSAIGVGLGCAVDCSVGEFAGFCVGGVDGVIVGKVMIGFWVGVGVKMDVVEGLVSEFDG